MSSLVPSTGTSSGTRSPACFSARMPVIALRRLLHAEGHDPDALLLPSLRFGRRLAEHEQAVDLPVPVDDHGGKSPPLGWTNSISKQCHSRRKPRMPPEMRLPKSWAQSTRRTPIDQVRWSSPSPFRFRWRIRRGDWQKASIRDSGSGNPQTRWEVSLEPGLRPVKIASHRKVIFAK